MKRRDFIALLGSAAARPLKARAEQPTIPGIELLHPPSRGDGVSSVAAFRRGLEETGFVEGKNLVPTFLSG
jgi:putative tryptophan/tyrosine transport system substrate-binding protein